MTDEELTEQEKQANRHYDNIAYETMMAHYWECLKCQRDALVGRMCEDGDALYTAWKNLVGLKNQ